MQRDAVLLFTAARAVLVLGQVGTCLEPLGSIIAFGAGAAEEATLAERTKRIAASELRSHYCFHGQSPVMAAVFPPPPMVVD